MWGTTILKIALTGNQSLAQKYLKMFSEAYYQNELAPNYFLSFEENLDGIILLGYTENNKPFGLDEQDLVRHVLIAGQSGTGKSNLNRQIILQSQQNKIHTLHFDRKGDLEHLAGNIDNICWTKIRLNPLIPPHPACSIEEWRNDFTKTFAELFDFWSRGLSIFLSGVDALYKKFDVYEKWKNEDTSQFPTIIDLLNIFKDIEFAKNIRGQGRESLLSITDKLTALIIQLEPIVSCQKGFSVEKLFTEKRTINFAIEGLDSLYQNFLIVIYLLNYYHYFKLFGGRGNLNLIVVFDEAKGLLGKKNQDKFIVSDLISKVREFGIGIVASDQIPSEISQFFFSNIGTLITFRLSDGMDLQRIQYSAGMSVDQIKSNYSLKIGEAIVRTMKCKDLIKIKVPYQEYEKFISRTEIDRLMHDRLEELNRDVVPYQKKEQKEERKKGISLDDTERWFLEHLAKDFCKTTYQLYQELGLNSSAGFRLKQRLLSKKFISEVSTNLGKGGKRANFLIPNPLVFEEFSIELGSGRGGPLHRHFQAELKKQAEQLGFVAVIEHSAGGTSEAPDIGLERLGIKVAIELAITSKPSQEVMHIEKNFRLGYLQVIMTFVNRQILEKTQALAKARYPDLTQVRFCMVQQFTAILGAL